MTGDGGSDAARTKIRGRWPVHRDLVAVGAVAPYINLFFQSLGLSLGEIGILAAVLALVALVAAPAWGALADQLLGSRAALVAASLAAAALSAVVGLTDVVIVAISFAILYQLVAPGLGPILDAYTLDLVRREPKSILALSRLGLGCLRRDGGRRGLSERCFFAASVVCGPGRDAHRRSRACAVHTEAHPLERRALPRRHARSNRHAPAGSLSSSRRSSCGAPTPWSTASSRST